MEYVPLIEGNLWGLIIPLCDTYLSTKKKKNGYLSNGAQRILNKGLKDLLNTFGDTKKGKDAPKGFFA